MTGDFEEGVIFDIIDHVGRRFGRYHESLMKTSYDLADFFPPGSGWWGWGVGVKWGVFSMFKDLFKPIKYGGETVETDIW